jgi:hypothetical protein
MDAGARCFEMCIPNSNGQIVSSGERAPIGAAGEPLIRDDQQMEEKNIIDKEQAVLLKMRRQVAHRKAEKTMELLEIRQTGFSDL